VLKKKWFSKTVVSSDGHSVSILDRATILYEEKKRRIYVSAEMLAPRHAWALNPSDMRVGSVRGIKLQDEALRSLIVRRIQEVFEFLGLSPVVG
jgi:hypothetical protein